MTKAAKAAFVFIGNEIKHYLNGIDTFTPTPAPS